MTLVFALVSFAGLVATVLFADRFYATRAAQDAAGICFGIALLAAAALILPGA